MPIINGHGGQAKFVINKLYSVGGRRLIALYYNGAIEDITGLEDLYEREGIVLPDPIYILDFSFAEASDDQIDAVITLAQAGQIDISDYWTVGDTRTVSLAAMDAINVSESHPAQDAVLEVAHSFEKNGDLGDISAENGSLLIQLKHCLTESGYMNSTETYAGGWLDSNRRAWCNQVFPDSLPACFKDHMLTMNIKTYNNGGVTVTQDKSALWCEKNVFGSRIFSHNEEANAATQVEIYKTAANRLKKTNYTATIDTATASNWWERSPNSGNSVAFCFVNSSGTATDVFKPTYTIGIAPFFCV